MTQIDGQTYLLLDVQEHAELLRALHDHVAAPGVIPAVPLRHAFPGKKLEGSGQIFHHETDVVDSLSPGVRELLPRAGLTIRLRQFEDERPEVEDRELCPCPCELSAELCVRVLDGGDRKSQRSAVFPSARLTVQCTAARESTRRPASA